MNSILTKNQYAFRTLHSAIIFLANSIKYWRQNTDNQKLNATIFLDLKKAFDTVNHKILINNLMKYGITGKEIEWLKSCPSGRMQFCTVNGHKSRIQEGIGGIPQGSCLGPLLFIMYLKDFASCLEFSKANMYTDETHRIIASTDIAELIRMTNKELLNISG